MSNNENKNKEPELKLSRLSKSLCYEENVKGKVKLYVDLRKLITFFTSIVLSWWLLVAIAFYVRDYVPMGVKPFALLSLFIVSFVPVITITIGLSEKAEVLAINKLYPKQESNEKPAKPSKAFFIIIRTILSVFQSAVACLIVVLASVVTSHAFSLIDATILFGLVFGLVELYQFTRLSEKDLVMNKKWLGSASLHTSATFNMETTSLGITEVRGLARDSHTEIKKLSEQKHTVTLKSHLINPTTQKVFQRELRNSLDWTVDDKLIRSSDTYSFWGVALSSLGYGRSLEVEPTYKMVIRRLTDVEKTEKVTLLKQKKAKTSKSNQNIEIKGKTVVIKE